MLLTTALWLWCPHERKSVVTTLIVYCAAFSSLILSGLLTTLDFKSLGKGLHEASILVFGIAVIRIFGFFLFRLILPLCRVNLSSILGDLAVFAGYVAWMLIYLHEAGLNLSEIVVTSSVLTAVLAFSMQDTLGNVISGLTLQLDNSIKLGDWVEIDDISGRVSEVRWRYTAIETRSWEMIIIPNSLLMKNKFTIHGRRKNQPLQWRRSITFDVSYKNITGQVIDIVQNAIINGQIMNVANTPSPRCILMALNPNAAHYSLRYWLTNLEFPDSVDSMVRSRIYAALQRSGMDFTCLQQNIHLTYEDDIYRQNKHVILLKERIEALNKIEFFNTLNDSEMTEVAENLVYSPFAEGDTIMRQGEHANWLFIIKSGVTDIFLEVPNRERRLISSTNGRCFLGEMGLMTGAPRSATVIARTDIIAYRLDKESFQKILTRRPDLANEISKLLVSRLFSNKNSQQQQIDSETHEKVMSEQRRFLLLIRDFFGLG
jgi:small-conductance mechanosensitive channel/CRP-like cAMP-binding protein